MVICFNIVDPATFEPSTIFFSNKDIADGTGANIANQLLNLFEEIGLNVSKVIGFGSDGASAMTGLKNGATGHLMRENPHIINVHCIAHRLALATSQAAIKVEGLKDVQETVTSLFLLFQIIQYAGS